MGQTQVGGTHKAADASCDHRGFIPQVDTIHGRLGDTANDCCKSAAGSQ